MLQLTMDKAISDNECQEYGYKWESEPVQRRMGKNASDVRVVNDEAQILVVTDVEKFEAAFPGWLVNMSDQQSTRVQCQGIGRLDRFHGGKAVSGNRTAVINRLKGVRVRVSTPAGRPLPDGTTYFGTDEMAFRQQLVSIYTTLGVENAIAIQLAQVARW